MSVHPGFWKMTIHILYLDKQVSEEKSIYNSIFNIYTIYLLTYYADPPQNAFNEFAMCVLFYLSQQNFTGCHT